MRISEVLKIIYAHIKVKSFSKKKYAKETMETLIRELNTDEIQADIKKPIQSLEEMENLYQSQQKEINYLLNYKDRILKKLNFDETLVGCFTDVFQLKNKPFSQDPFVLIERHRLLNQINQMIIQFKLFNVHDGVINIKYLTRFPSQFSQDAELNAKLLDIAKNITQLSIVGNAIGLKVYSSKKMRKALPLTHLPDSFSELFSALKTLRIKQTNLTILPENIGELGRLKKLFLNNNRVNQLPQSITQLKNLERLNIANNNLRAIPENIANLPLEKLCLNKNYLIALPNNLSRVLAKKMDRWRGSFIDEEEALASQYSIKSRSFTNLVFDLVEDLVERFFDKVEHHYNTMTQRITSFAEKINSFFPQVIIPSSSSIQLKYPDEVLLLVLEKLSETKEGFLPYRLVSQQFNKLISADVIVNSLAREQGVTREVLYQRQRAEIAYLLANKAEIFENLKGTTSLKKCFSALSNLYDRSSETVNVLTIYYQHKLLDLTNRCIIRSRIDCFGYMRTPYYTSLELEHLTRFPNNIFSVRELAAPVLQVILNNIDDIVISGKLLTRLPDQFLNFPILKSLKITKTLIEEIPDNFIVGFQQLQTLNIEQNRIKALSDQIGQLPSLQTLSVDKNCLTKLPENLSEKTFKSTHRMIISEEKVLAGQRKRKVQKNLQRAPKISRNDIHIPPFLLILGMAVGVNFLFGSMMLFTVLCMTSAAFLGGDKFPKKSTMFEFLKGQFVSPAKNPIVSGVTSAIILFGVGMIFGGPLTLISSLIIGGCVTLGLEARNYFIIKAFNDVHQLEENQNAAPTLKQQAFQDGYKTVKEGGVKPYLTSYLCFRDLVEPFAFTAGTMKAQAEAPSENDICNFLPRL